MKGPGISPPYPTPQARVVGPEGQGVGLPAGMTSTWAAYLVLVFFAVSPPDRPTRPWRATKFQSQRPLRLSGRAGFVPESPGHLSAFSEMEGTREKGSGESTKVRGLWAGEGGGRGARDWLAAQASAPPWLHVTPLLYLERPTHTLRCFQEAGPEPSAARPTEASFLTDPSPLRLQTRGPGDCARGQLEVPCGPPEDLTHSELSGW